MWNSIKNSAIKSNHLPIYLYVKIVLDFVHELICAENGYTFGGNFKINCTNATHELDGMLVLLHLLLLLLLQQRRCRSHDIPVLQLFFSGFGLCPSICLCEITLTSLLIRWCCNYKTRIQNRLFKGFFFSTLQSIVLAQVSICTFRWCLSAVVAIRTVFFCWNFARNYPPQQCFVEIELSSLREREKFWRYFRTFFVVDVSVCVQAR